MKNNETIVIAEALRTPVGNLLGIYKDLKATELGATVIKALLEKKHLDKNLISYVIMGNVLPAGLGQAPARQAAILGGLDYHVPALTINKMCGSGLEAVIIACLGIYSEPQKIIIAGGMESMTNAPYLIAKVRQGYRFGHKEIFDHMFLDGLEDAYQPGKLMGVFAEETAKKFNILREKQDEYATASVNKAKVATEKAFFKDEIAPVTDPKTQTIFTMDEGVTTAKPEKIPQLKAAFAKDGTITAANSSSISDGAAALILLSEKNAKEKNIKPIAKIVGFASFAQEPAWFTTAPVFAIQKLLKKINWQMEDVDLFEINEAFSVVTLVAMQQLKIPAEKLNVHGGACVLGHPIGASGARILVTLVHALKQKKLKRGIAAICIGGGEALAMAIEIE